MNNDYLCVTCAQNEEVYGCFVRCRLKWGINPMQWICDNYKKKEEV